MSRIQPRSTLPEQVADQLRRRIASGEFPVGTRIPTEHDLAEDLGVSRNSVREAVRALVHAGMLGARAGYGTFVTATSDLAPTLARRVDQDREQDVAEVRAVLEREGARLAALRATDVQIGALKEALVSRAVAADDHAYAAADITFHRILMEASGNALLAELYRGVGGNEQALLHFSQEDINFADRPTAIAAIDDEHTAIVRAVAAHEADDAADAATRAVTLVQDYAVVHGTSLGASHGPELGEAGK
ncbi:FCD domain-containing protein [Corynebacterium sp. USCH3]|uniref:FadR/GntR family transcriptional regulator n=1 Tax=Corynebacterium sp. USCH3 TaxID=3024840 RepID=UPI0030992C21